jgi:hypothetical protein
MWVTSKIIMPLHLIHHNKCQSILQGVHPFIPSDANEVQPVLRWSLTISLYGHGRSARYRGTDYIEFRMYGYKCNAYLVCQFNKTTLENLPWLTAASQSFVFLFYFDGQLYWPFRASQHGYFPDFSLLDSSTAD